MIEGNAKTRKLKIESTGLQANGIRLATVGPALPIFAVRTLFSNSAKMILETGWDYHGPNGSANCRLKLLEHGATYLELYTWVDEE